MGQVIVSVESICQLVWKRHTPEGRQAIHESEDYPSRIIHEFSGVACARLVSMRKLRLIRLRQSLRVKSSSATSPWHVHLAYDGDIV